MLRSRDKCMMTTAMAAALLLVLLSAQANALAADLPGPSAQPPDMATLVKRIVDAQLDSRARSKPYSVTREYKVFGSDNNRPRTEVLAQINFLPPNVKSYGIDQSTGGMGEKVVRRILDHEVDATRDPKTMMVNDSNYEFAFLGEGQAGGQPCYKLEITPKHERKDLLDAVIWVDKDSYRILRIEGDPVKSPSFWVKDVHVVIEFAEVAGMWLQTATQAMAHLRFGGEYRIVSQDLNYDITQTVAANRPMTRRRHSSAIMAVRVR
jgi:outer membrane lipoprotein-sorting protein